MRQRRLRERPENFSIDYGHPLAQGLMFAGLGSCPGSKKYIDSSIKNISSSLVNMTTSDWIWSPFLNRYVLQFDGSTKYVISQDPLSDNGFLGDITVCCWANITSGGLDRHFVGKHLVNGASANPFDFRTDNSATPVVTLVRANTAYKIHSGPTATLGSFVNYGFTSVTNISIAPTFYKNGVSSVGTFVVGTPTGAATGTLTPIRIGIRTDGAIRMIGQMCDTMIWSRILSAKDMQQLADPYNVMLNGMLKPPKRRFYPGIVIAQPLNHTIGKRRNRMFQSSIFHGVVE